MQLIAPDILADASGLAPGLSACGILLGLALWLFGWRRHRFWVVLGLTLAGGVYGLNEGASLHAQPVVAGIALACAAGLLALSLARLIAFSAAGLAALLAVQSLVPTWDQPLVSFVSGGILGVLLFRLWVMALTSLAGALLMTYSGLCLAERLAKLNPAEFAERRTTLLNWACGGLAALGLLLQLLLNRRQPSKPAGKGKEKGKRPEPRPALPEAADEPAGKKRPWWGWPSFRKAG
jgi:hypothetical protein